MRAPLLFVHVLHLVRVSERERERGRKRDGVCVRTIYLCLCERVAWIHICMCRGRYTTRERRGHLCEISIEMDRRTKNFPSVQAMRKREGAAGCWKMVREANQMNTTKECKCEIDKERKQKCACG